MGKDNKRRKEAVTIFSDHPAEKSSFLHDASDTAAQQKGHTIEFYHIPTRRAVAFKAWVTDYNEQYTSTWNSEEVYGRMDPIQTFVGTKRVIDLSWDVVARSEAEAKDNLERCSLLFKMLYPTYRGETMSAPPLLKLKFVNLIQNVATGSKGTTAPAKLAGLVGTADGFTFTPDMEDSGFFDPGTGTVYPQKISLKCTFTVLHTHKLGGGKAWEKFPYNRTTEEKPPAPAGAPTNHHKGLTRVENINRYRPSGQNYMPLDRPAFNRQQAANAKKLEQVEKEADKRGDLSLFEIDPK